MFLNKHLLISLAAALPTALLHGIVWLAAIAHDQQPNLFLCHCTACSRYAGTSISHLH
jgi:hypothetical protein